MPNLRSDACHCEPYSYLPKLPCYFSAHHRPDVQLLRPPIPQVAGDAIRPLCRLHRLDSFSFARARGYTVYNDALHRAILLLKYEEVTGLGDSPLNSPQS
jgi:hypothetical protein